ncbi:MAG: FHA domain-containing protein [Nitrospirae bacterium]|nr:MAG: FHA domain-containing protein [Nitrospirota bacterium]
MPFKVVAKTSRPSGETAGETKECAGALLRIGRGADSELLLDDPAVRPAHAAIQEVSGVYILRNIGEGEPTFVNDKPAKEAILTSKGTIRIGPYLLEFSRPSMTSPLRIEWKHLRAALPERDAPEASATLVLPVSPFAAKPAPDDPDATQSLPPVKQDPDKTMVLTPPAAATQPVDADATHKLDPITDPKRDDPDKTLVVPPPK